MRVILALIIGLSLVSGCARVSTRPGLTGESILDFPQLIAKIDRLNNVSLPLLTAAADLCEGDAQLIYGFELHDQQNYAEVFHGKYQAAAVRYYDLGEEVSVRYVHPHLPAAAAGLPAGATVLSLDGLQLENADHAARIIRTLTRRKEGPLEIIIREGERSRTVYIHPVLACKYPVLLFPHDVINAFADGHKISVTTGMMDFVTTDSELALVIGHEIAHNILQHSESIRLDTLLDDVLSAYADPRQRHDMAKRSSFSKEFEAEADYVGVYIAARAGFDISSAGAFWSRVGQRRFHPPTDRARLYPTSPERFAALQETIREIERKRERGESLLPTPHSFQGSEEQ
jgi:hypothetical protein